MDSTSVDREPASDTCGDLDDALDGLRDAKREAREEGFPSPSNAALGSAERLLRALHGISPRRFEVYPTPDGEVAIDAPGGRGRSVLLPCDSGGGALCLVNANGKHRRARYDDARSLPDCFIREALIGQEWEDTHAAEHPDHRNNVTDFGEGGTT